VSRLHLSCIAQQVLLGLFFLEGRDADLSSANRTDEEFYLGRALRFTAVVVLLS
jgi:hypothetical protein